MRSQDWQFILEGSQSAVYLMFYHYSFTVFLIVSLKLFIYDIMFIDTRQFSIINNKCEARRTFILTERNL